MGTAWDVIIVVLNRFLKKKEIAQVLTVEQMLQPADKDGNNCEIIRFRTKILLDSGVQVMKYFLIKNLPSDKAKLQKIVDFGYFVNEIVVYRDLFPSMRKVMTKNWVFTEPVWGRSINCFPYERIVLEDLLECGYQHCKELDFDHATKVVDELAKFHALSVAIKEKRPIPFDILGVERFEKHLDIHSIEHQTLFEDFLEYSEKHWGREWLPQLSRFERFVAGDITELIFEKIENPENTFSVLNHGDLCKSNLLFQYEDGSNEPTSMKFIDFQKAGFRSPAFDLQYLLSTTTNTQLRKDYKKLLRTYCISLLCYMCEMDCSTYPITLKRLTKEVRDLQIYGVFISVTVLPKLLNKENSFAQNEENRDEYLTRMYGGEEYTNFMQYLLGKFGMNKFKKQL